MKKTNKKGFTLAELLVVVAIIAVLVAVAIPIFTSQLEKSREAVDAANIRAAYAEVLSNKVSGETDEKLISKTVKLTQEKAEWQNSFEFPENLKSTESAAQPTGTKDQEVTIKATDSGAEINIALKKK
ncbi:MAG: prepilin-type N-terminal cleavage/methylation domain-containing protein [Bulleidia sp.]|nr:prepilin-type N-terminal cleavage/methylation domain-containing protein [Bulleidia sp.]